MKDSFFTYDHDGDGFSLYPTEEEAKKVALEIIESYRDDAISSGEGWPDTIDEICYGKIIGRAVMKNIESGSFPEYTLEPVRPDQPKPIENPQIVEFQGGKFIFSVTDKEVEVKPFGMSAHLITNLEYERFDPKHSEKRDRYSNQDNQPVVRISWEDAVRYCQWLTEQTGEHYRLPMETEWEFAASGGGQRQYPWGNEEPSLERANYYKSKIGKTMPVGSYSLGMTPEGLSDMAGNVWEWCDDLYDKECGRVVRGGSFLVNVNDLRCAARGWIDPHFWYFFCGFRVVRGPLFLII